MASRRRRSALLAVLVSPLVACRATQAPESVSVVPLRHVAASQIAPRAALAVGCASLRVTPDERTNSVILAGRASAVTAAELWLERADVE